MSAYRFTFSGLRALAFAVVLAGLFGSGTDASAAARTVIAFGDSLVAGFGLPESAAFPTRLEAELRRRGHDVTVFNAGVSGDTSSGGLARLDWSIPEGTAAVIVELGANDMLRGIEPAQTAANLEAILVRLKERGIAVLLAGMRASPNMGNDYMQAFDAIYPELAKKHSVLFYPFFLDGVAGEPGLNQPDGMHPNEMGVEAIVARMAPSVEKLLDAAEVANH